MIKEKSYKYKNYQISYDEGLKDRSALVIGVKEKDTLYITGELYDESAHMVIEILNNLENENERLHSIIKEVREDMKEVRERYNYYGNDNFDLSILSFWIKKLEILDKEKENE